MNREEILNKYIDLIDKGYCCACNELNCIDNFPHAKITHAIKELEQENQELKKQLEEERNKVREYSYKLSNFRCEETYENQQKEFIEWLESERNINPYDISDYTYEDIINTILSKYEDIIEK